MYIIRSENYLELLFGGKKDYFIMPNTEVYNKI